MTFNELCEYYLNLTKDERIKRASYYAKKYLGFCKKHTDNYHKAVGLFVGSLVPFFGVDREVDNDEYNFFIELTKINDVSFDEFYDIVSRWTKVKVIEQSNLLVEECAKEDEKEAFCHLGLCLITANNFINRDEYLLAIKYLEKKISFK